MPIGAVKCALLHDGARVPIRASDGAAGYDVFAHNEQIRDDRRSIVNWLEEPVTISPGEARLFGIGVAFALPEGYEIQVRPRSGLANKHDIELANSPGTVDPDYRGEVGVLLRNRGTTPFQVERGMRIAQLLFSTVETPQLVKVTPDELSATPRGTGGFGSTQLFGEGFGTKGYEAAIRRLDMYFLGIVRATARLSDCVRGAKRNAKGIFIPNPQGGFRGQTRRFGCIFGRGKHTIASGYNCQAPGQPKCAEVGCLRDELNIPSGEQINVCRAVHAEWNALAAVAEIGASIDGATMYVNAEPCGVCALMIAGLRSSGLEALVVFGGVYDNNRLDIVRDAGVSVRVRKNLLAGR